MAVNHARLVVHVTALARRGILPAAAAVGRCAKFLGVARGRHRRGDAGSNRQYYSQYGVFDEFHGSHLPLMNLSNACFRTSEPNACLGFGKLDSSIQKIGSAFVCHFRHVLNV